MAVTSVFTNPAHAMPARNTAAVVAAVVGVAVGYRVLSNWFAHNNSTTQSNNTTHSPSLSPSAASETHQPVGRRPPPVQSVNIDQHEYTNPSGEDGIANRTSNARAIPTTPSPNTNPRVLPNVTPRASASATLRTSSFTRNSTSQEEEPPSNGASGRAPTADTPRNLPPQVPTVVPVTNPNMAVRLPPQTANRDVPVLVRQNSKGMENGMAPQGTSQQGNLVGSHLLA